MSIVYPGYTVYMDQTPVDSAVVNPGAGFDLAGARVGKMSDRKQAQIEKIISLGTAGDAGEFKQYVVELKTLQNLTYFFERTLMTYADQLAINLDSTVAAPIRRKTTRMQIALNDPILHWGNLPTNPLYSEVSKQIASRARAMAKIPTNPAPISKAFNDYANLYGETLSAAYNPPAGINEINLTKLDVENDMGFDKISITYILKKCEECLTSNPADRDAVYARMAYFIGTKSHTNPLPGWRNFFAFGVYREPRQTGIIDDKVHEIRREVEGAPPGGMGGAILGKRVWTTTQSVGGREAGVFAGTGYKAPPTPRRTTRRNTSSRRDTRRRQRR